MSISSSFKVAHLHPSEVYVKLWSKFPGFELKILFLKLLNLFLPVCRMETGERSV